MDHPAALTRDLIGRESEVVLFEVERGAIRKFADAVLSARCGPAIACAADSGWPTSITATDVWAT